MADIAKAARTGGAGNHAVARVGRHGRQNARDDTVGGGADRRRAGRARGSGEGEVLSMEVF